MSPNLLRISSPAGGEPPLQLATCRSMHSELARAVSHLQPRGTLHPAQGARAPSLLVVLARFSVVREAGGQRGSMVIPTSREW